ncbi:transporter substrate-binding domain-containing protein [Photobacterium angustum]|uniref:Solute-binding protein family 3/N-terminal domain-containing protein n=1 Tax=Photobacterium angustum TaxID=661 RepID=A0A855SKV6_PHOAN|nr:transporter substrate-binding domain-containing protein [Photobacterium angustum]PSX08760.1 hypothetical protein C0W41_06675 [Photobacterium angustum]PSX14375.1 hypothetical protein C0W55_11215 [Photobacterium angustum]PSX22650.1 hypothetical protein C0W36_15725 [Photobacterium angustum]PSX41696.1 hypothetical protein C0W34_06620 [Photobacterium angustum]
MNDVSASIKKLFLLSLIATPMVSNASTESNNIQFNTITDNTLTVCTTGDYPPLTSFNSEKNTFEGFAPIVAANFAKHLNLNLAFTRTTWKDLSDDLKSGKCDIAMGGITYTKDRSKDFYLSKSVAKNQKAAVFTKDNDELFNSFKDIDKKENTILENKGGTNEKFANEIISKATINVLESNLAVFDCFKKYQLSPYVMFTDSIEIQYRSKLSDSVLSNKGLGIALTNNPETYKVYMANKTESGEEIILAMNNFIDLNKANMKKWYQESLTTKYKEEAQYCPF